MSRHETPPSGDAVLEARGLVLRYLDGEREVLAVDHVDLRVARGEFVGLVGPSGSGKSSLLFVIAGLRPPHEGEVRLLGNVMPPSADASASFRRGHIGFLFQEPFLIPYLTVRENALTHHDSAAAEQQLKALAEATGMDALLDERPHRLSGGERQRAGILRALVGQPDLILADEPTASLDHATGQAVMQVLRDSRKHAGLVVVTHDPSMLAGADRVLEVRDGRLLPTESGPSDDRLLESRME